MISSTSDLLGSVGHSGQFTTPSASIISIFMRARILRITLNRIIGSRTCFTIFQSGSCCSLSRYWSSEASKQLMPRLVGSPVNRERRWTSRWGIYLRNIPGSCLRKGLLIVCVGCSAPDTTTKLFFGKFMSPAPNFLPTSRTCGK